MVKVKFYGGTEEVGNVRITLQYQGKTLCLDYGIKQNAEDEATAFPIVDYVVVSHGHLDHVGNLGYASRLNKETRFVGTATTKRLSKYQLEDILKIEKRKQLENPQLKPNPRSFTKEDIENVNQNWIPIDYNDSLKLGEFEVKLLNAGHIPGSSIIETRCGDKRVVYTGDINLEGNLHREFPDLEKLAKNPDVLIIESTYGDRIRDGINKEEALFLNYVREALDKGKNIFIPAFAIERIQRVGSLLDKLQPEFPEYSFYIVSPSYMKIKDLAYRGVNFPNLKEQVTLPDGYKGSKSVVVSTSGFCNGGFSKKVLKEVIDNKNYTLIIPSGFLPNDSPIKTALETGYVEFSNRGVKSKKVVRADIKQVSLSAHSDMNGLIKIVETVCPDKKTDVYLVHGEPASQSHLKQMLEARGYNVKIPKKYDTIEY